jgi:hypothetical protein
MIGRPIHAQIVVHKAIAPCYARNHDTLPAESAKCPVRTLGSATKDMIGAPAEVREVCPRLVVLLLDALVVLMLDMLLSILVVIMPVIIIVLFLLIFVLAPCPSCSSSPSP